MPQLAACIWIGYPGSEIPLLNVEGVPEMVGGSIPAEIWHDFMAGARPHARRALHNAGHDTWRALL